MSTRRQFIQSSVVLAAALMSGSLPAAASAGAAGFRLPEETEPHERTFMQWPVNRQVHPDPGFLNMLQQTIADIANTISEFEPVVMLMDQKHQKRARRRLSSKVEIWDIPTDDLWCRDAGPVFVTNAKGDLAISQLNFNGWGNKQVHGNDRHVAARVAKRLGVPVFDNGIVGEAGGVESDGGSTLMAHESSWVNPNRNKGSKKQIETKLLEALGATKMIWAPGVKGADITDYHIDSLARFTKPGVVVIQLPEQADPDDPWSRAAFETHDILRQATDGSGRRLEIEILPEPNDIRVISRDFVASYVNYYVCNGALVTAQFGDRDTDAEAVSILRKLYPGREVIALNVDPVGETGGGIHCATQQQPKVT